jgi:hypothetical protein
MQKYKAAQDFYALLLSNPDDFDAYSRSGRIFDDYVIHHRYRAVQIAIQVEHQHGCSIVVIPDDKKDVSINFADSEVIKNLLVWAKRKIDNKEVVKKINQDDNNVSKLVQYYKDKTIIN